MLKTSEMYTLNYCLLLVYLISVELCNSDKEVTVLEIVFICDDEIEPKCTRAAGNVLPMEIEIAGDMVNLVGFVVKDMGNFFSNLDLLDKYVRANNNTSLLVGVGSDSIVNAVTCVADQLDIPAVTYITSHHRTAIFEQSSVTINTDHAGIARAILTIIGSGMSKNTFIICEDSLSQDGFLDVIARFDWTSRINTSHHILVSNTDCDFDLELKLRFIHDSGFRVIVVHSSPKMLKRLLSVADSLSYVELGYAWIVTEESLSDNFVDTSEITDYPNGLLAIEGHEDEQIEGLLTDVIEAYRDQVADIEVDSVTELFKTVPSFSQDIIKGIRTSSRLFTNNGSRKNMTFRLLNFVRDVTDSGWRTVGYIQDDDLDLQTVVWPGHSIFGPNGIARESYTIATRPAEPFMYIWGPILSASECAGAVQCLQVYTYDPLHIKQAVESFKQQVRSPNVSYDIHCCEGVVVDILNNLAAELDFDYILYFQNDSNFGHLHNGTWTGMISDVISGAADMMAGAISVTSDRLEGVAFTEPFYYSSFNMISSSSEKYYSLLAFTKPFDASVWVMIVLSANVTAIITSLFEWNSPFGLNPWGKRRKRNYTYGSALTMVYSIWYGHTVSTKSPKSWPSKFLQNIWATMSIFILASYTANLAAFLAGNTNEDLMYSILDSKLSTKKIGVVKTSASEEYTKAINSDLASRFSRYYVKDVKEGISSIRQKKIDMYMDDTLLLEHALSIYDDNCSMKYAAHTSGDSAYAFAVKPGSHIKTRLDPYILNYMELGLTEDLRWRYMGKGRQCENKRMDSSELQFGLPHTAGLFVMLLVAVGLSFIVLIIEHVLYFCILPWLRKRPQNSIWKSRNVEYVSQRIYRAIHSEKVTSTTQVMVTRVKQKKVELQTKLRRQINSASSSSVTSPYPSIISKLPGFTNTEFFPPYHPSRNGVYTISENISEAMEDELFDDMYLSVLNENDAYFNSNPAITHHYHYTGQDNPGFESDDDISDTVFMDRGPLIEKTKRCHSERVAKNTNIRKTVRDGIAKRRTIHSDSDLSSIGKRYETWPSPKQRRKSLKRLHKTNNNDSTSLTPRDSSFPKMGSRIVNEIQTPDSYRKHSAVSLDCYRVNRQNFPLKDNRVKSNIRHHAMAYRRGPTLSVDESAVEALSKEDLLVLWKRSEIELQTKLNRIIHQNTHLRRLVNIVEDHATRRRSGDVESSNNTSSNLNPEVIISTQL